jgi:putative sterol carrier protein
LPITELLESLEEMMMSHPTDVFFDALSLQGHDPALHHRTGTVRFDVSRGKKVDHWSVVIDNGKISVHQANGPADCAVAVDQQLFEAILAGETDPMAAMLRGTLLVEGDAELLLVARRLLQTPATIAALGGRS